MPLTPISLRTHASATLRVLAHARHATALALFLALAACGGGDDTPAPPPAAPQDTLQFQPRDTVVAMQPADTATVVTVTPQANGDPNQVSVGFAGVGPQAAVGQVLAIPANADRGLPFGFTGKVESIKQGAAGPEYVLKSAALTDVFKNLNLDFSSARGGMQAVGMIGPNGKVSMVGPSRVRPLSAGTSGVGGVTNKVLEDGSISLELSAPFELPLNEDGSLKMYLEFSGTDVVVRQQTVVVEKFLEVPCSFPGCTSEMGRPRPVTTRNQVAVDGKFNVAFGVKGEKDIFDPSKRKTAKDLLQWIRGYPGINWDDLNRSVGFGFELNGLDGSDKEGLIPLGGVILAPGVASTFKGDNPPGFDVLKNLSIIIWFYIGLDGEISVSGDAQLVNVEVPVNFSYGFTDDGGVGEAVDVNENKGQSVVVKSALTGTSLSAEIDFSATMGVDAFVGGIRPIAVRFDAFAYHLKGDLSAENAGIQYFPVIDKPFSGALCYSANHTAVSGRTTVMADVEIGKKFKSGGWKNVDKRGGSVPELGLELSYSKEFGGYDWIAGKILERNELPAEKSLAAGCFELDPTDLAVDVSLNPDQTANAQMSTYRLDISRSGAFTKTNATSLKVIDQWVEGNDEIPVELFTDPANGNRYGVINLFKGASHVLKISAVSDKFGDLSVTTTAEVQVPEPGKGNNLLSGALVTDSCATCPEGTYGNPNYLTDGNLTTGRNLGTYSGNFNFFSTSPINLGRIRMLPNMSPNGNVDYEVLTTTDANPTVGSTWVSHGRSTESWASGIWFEKTISNINPGARAVKIIIYSSPSWVALMEVEGFGANFATEFFDSFDGSSLDSNRWNINLGAGGISVADGQVTLGNSSSADTKGKFNFKIDSESDRIVVEGRFFGPSERRDTVVSLVDLASGSRVNCGQSNYWGGMYLNGGGDFGFSTVTGGGNSSVSKEYRLTISGRNVTCQVGATLDQIEASINGALPTSISGHSLYLVIGTGSVYSPGTFEWVRVYVAR